MRFIKPFIDKDNLLITEKGNIKVYNLKEKEIYKISHNLRL